MNFIAALGRTLLALRQEAKLSQEQLAHEAGVYRNTVGLIERGEMSVSVQTLDQICDALGYRPWQLMLEAEFLMEAEDAGAVAGTGKAKRQVEATAVAVRQAARKVITGEKDAAKRPGGKAVGTKTVGARKAGDKAEG